MQSHLKIGDVAREIGVSTDIIRLYEKIGVFNPDKRTPAGTRLYTKDQIENFKFLVMFKNYLGVSFEDMAKWFELRNSTDKPEGKKKALDHLRRRKGELEQKIRILSEWYAGADDLIHCLSRGESIDVKGPDGLARCPVLKRFKNSGLLQ